MTHTPDATMRIAVLFSGRGTNLEALINGAGRYQVCVAISNRPNAGGIKIAQDHEIPSLCVDHKEFPDRATFEQQLLTELEAYRVDLVVLAGFMRVLTNTFINPWEGKIINIHPSLLPKYPGLSPHKSALENGDSEHGATVHYVIPELDAGPIILQKSLPINKDDDETSLLARTLKVEHRILVQAVNDIAAGKTSYAALSGQAPD